MNKINLKGENLIQYKNELKKEYPDLVKQSMIIALQQLLDGKIIDREAFELTKNETVDIEEFREYLLSKKDYMKTEKEILAEMDIIKQDIFSCLKSMNIENNLVLKSVADKEKFIITRKFTIDENFVVSYFGVPEEDLLKLMKRGEFVEKFAVLRLSKVFKDISQKIVKTELVNFDTSLVYFDSSLNGYSIDFVFEVNLLTAEDGKKLETACEQIKEIREYVEAVYSSKVLSAFV